jgi:hypothetical protein
VTIYPPTLYFFWGIVLVGNRNWQEMKVHSWYLRGCHPIRSFTLLMNGHNTRPLCGGGDMMDMKRLCAFHNQNTLGNFFQVLFDMYSALPSPWAGFLTCALIHG